MTEYNLSERVEVLEGLDGQASAIAVQSFDPNPYNRPCERCDGRLGPVTTVIGTGGTRPPRLYCNPCGDKVGGIIDGIIFGWRP